MIFGAYLQETANNMREGLKMVRNLALAKKLTQTQVHMRVLSRTKNLMASESLLAKIKLNFSVNGKMVKRQIL